MFIQNISTLLTYLTLFGHVIILFLIVSLLHPKLKSFLLFHFQSKALALAFVVSLVATLGSLFYSEVVGYVPCNLCWYQRIFMYPQVLLLGLATFKNDFKIFYYSSPLLIVGIFISLYHNYIYFRDISTAFCGIEGPGSCTTRYFFELSYITLPLMSLTAFVLIFLLLFNLNRASK